MNRKILVASWGYSMILTTWVKVVKVSPKTLLVQEIQHRGLTREEMAEQNLSCEYLQSYNIPVDVPVLYNGQSKAQFRLHNRGTVKRWVGDEEVEMTKWRGSPDGMESMLTFYEWDGKPELEDHAD